jgi:hypothetical protein
MDSKELLRALKSGSLDREAVEDAALRAVVEFADWLAHPMELGKYPDDIEVIDARALYWPPARETLPLTLLRYRVLDKSGFEPDDVGVGLVGSTTFALFSYENHLRPPEDCYAIHCYWESKGAELIVDSERVSPKQVEAALGTAGITIAKPSPVVSVRFAKHTLRKGRKPLDYPGDEVVLLAGELGGAAGWLVCDGRRSTWYPSSEMPEDAPASTVAMLHVGRVLLGFNTQGVERGKYKATRFGLDDPTFLARYERALTSARKASGRVRKEAFDSFGPIARHAGRYVTLLTAAQRTEDVKKFVDDLTPNWDHNAGYAELGKVAFVGGMFDVSKRFIEKLRESYPDHHRSETMGLLARIYAHEGRRADGVALLRDCISRIEGDTMCSPREVAAFSEPLLAVLRELER